MNRVYNLSAGPSCLPLEVLQKAQEEILCWGDSGMSVMEMTHRGKHYESIIGKAEQDLRTLMAIPENYKVLFLQGGASLQFAMVPLNLLSVHKKAHYINTGAFAKKAISEAKKYGEINVVATSEDKKFSYIPALSKEMFTPDADYVHITSNNTIEGTVFKTLPDVNGLPLVSDMSSCILSEVIDVRDYALIYAGAQKNIGPAGLTVVIVREDFLGKELDITPTMLKYSIHAKEDSLYNTPPTYAIYMAGLVFDWMLKNGGVAAVEENNKKKSALLYGYLDQSKLFKGTAEKKDRSMMNITFVTGNEDMDKKFVSEAAANGFVSLKGHRSVGGMRASIYNAFPLEGVEKLVAFMKKFEAENA
jgi:phosphoserine aminotransferase